MKKLIALCFVLSACTSPEHSEVVLESAGFTRIQMGGYAFWGCGSGDTFHTRFRAAGPTGKKVTGVVCCGIAKSCTIRID